LEVSERTDNNSQNHRQTIILRRVNFFFAMLKKVNITIVSEMKCYFPLFISILYRMLNQKERFSWLSMGKQKFPESV